MDNTADEYYSVPQNPVYDEKTIRKIQDNDPVRASTIVNPVLERMIENTSAVKKQVDKFTEHLREMEATSYYCTFGLADWTGGQMRIPKEKHHMSPRQSSCVFSLRGQSGQAGSLVPTWGSVGNRVYWDLDTMDLVVDSDSPFSGDIFVMGPMDTESDSGA